MSLPIENAREILMTCGKKRLMQNKDGKYGRFGLRELTSESGIALGTFYNYFESKDDLVLQIMDEDWKKTMKEIAETADRDISLYEKVKAIFESVSRFEQCYRLSVMTQMKPTKKNQAYRQSREKEVYDLIRNFLEKEIGEGELKLEARTDSAAYFLIQLFFAAGRNPQVDFDELWKCMNFKDTGKRKQRARDVLGCLPESCGIEVSGDSIVTKGVDNTIRNVGRMAREGMKETDREILDIMVGEKKSDS